MVSGHGWTGRLWTYVRDDKPFGEPDPPAAAFFYSPDRGGAHPEAHLAGWAGLLQADAYAGFGGLYVEGRAHGVVTEAARWAHGRRKFFAATAPIAIEAVRRIDAIFAIEREINGLAPDCRLAARAERVAPLVVGLHAWTRAERARVSAKGTIAKAMDYSRKQRHEHIWPFGFRRARPGSNSVFSTNRTLRRRPSPASSHQRPRMSDRERTGESSRRSVIAMLRFRGPPRLLETA